MADIARSHHENLQNRTFTRTPTNGKRPSGTSSSSSSPCIKPLREGANTNSLSNLITEDAVQKTLTTVPNGKAAGIDGLIHELWKELEMEYQASNGQGYNVVKVLTALFRDMQQHGLVAGSRFANGWLCPLCQKGEPADIRNYRPITLLNTDYKLFTQTLTSQLGADRVCARTADHGYDQASEIDGQLQREDRNQRRNILT